MFTCSKGSVLCRFFCTHGLLSLCLNPHKLLLSVWRLGPTWSSRSLPAMVTERTCSSRRETTRKVYPQFMNVHVQLFRVKEALARLLLDISSFISSWNLIYFWQTIYTYYNNKQRTLMGGTKIERIQLEHRIIFLPLTGTATVSRQMTQITPTTTGKYTIALLSVLAM